jgi:WD40 repeat protein
MKAWSTTTWQETATFSVMAERIDFHDAVFTPDGRNLVVARVGLAEPAVIEVLDASTHQAVRRISSQVSAFQLAFSPDGSLLASSWSTVDLWQGASSASARSIGTGGQEAMSVAFSPDGTLLAFSVLGQGVQVWSVPR